MPKKTLVFGASINPDRYSYLAIVRLFDKGHPVVAFGLNEGVVHGVKIDNKLKAYEKVDTVTLYMRPNRQVGYYDYLVSLKPKRVIFNPGTENPEFYRLLEKEGIDVEVACTLVLLGIDQF